MPWVDESLLAVLNSLEMQYTWLNQTKYLLVRWLTGNSFWNFCGIDCLPSAVLKVCSYPLPLALLTIMCCCFCLGLSSSSSFLKCFLPSLFSPFNSFLYKKKTPSFSLSSHSPTFPKRTAVKLACCLLLSQCIHLLLYALNPQALSILPK